MTYKALQDPIASPLKKAKMECTSDNIIQEVGFITRHLRRANLSTCPTARIVPKTCSTIDRNVKLLLNAFLTVCYSEDPLQRVDDSHQPVHQVHLRNTAPPGGRGGNYTRTLKKQKRIPFTQTPLTGVRDMIGTAYSGEANRFIPVFQHVTSPLHYLSQPSAPCI